MDKNMVKIRLADDDGNVETVWATSLGGDIYRIDNTPWYAYGISWNDIVEAKAPSPPEGLAFTRVVQKSGHRTVRIILDEAERPEALASLSGLGCTYEGSNGRFFGIDIPPQANFDAIVQFLSNSKY